MHAAYYILHTAGCMLQAACCPADNRQQTTDSRQQTAALPKETMACFFRPSAEGGVGKGFRLIKPVLQAPAACSPAAAISNLQILGQVEAVKLTGQDLLDLPHDEGCLPTLQAGESMSVQRSLNIDKTVGSRSDPIAPVAVLSRLLGVSCVVCCVGLYSS